jgi:malate permease and related proteins
MPFIQVFLNVLVPVFALVLLGYVIGPRLELQAGTLSRLAYYVISPAFVFTLLSTATLDPATTGRMAAFITCVYALSALLAFVLARAMRRSREMTAAWVMIAVFGNVGNFGLPISQFAQGREALVPATVYFIANCVLAFTVAVTAAKMTMGGNPLQAALGVVKTPSLIAAALAIVVNAIGLPIPVAVARPLELLAGALIPVMLVVLGVQLANAGIPKPDLNMMVPIGVRLIAGSALSLALVGVFGLTGIERNVGILQGSMPGAVLVSLIALENKMMPNYMTATVLLSNVLSAVSLAVVLAVM